MNVTISSGSIGRNIRIGPAITLIFLTVLCMHASALAKRKDDVVVLNNGDRITGEIKRLEYGTLSLKADYMADAVRLDWKRVERMRRRSSVWTSTRFASRRPVLLPDYSSFRALRSPATED
jgi:hypothetical protein